MKPDVLIEVDDSEGLIDLLDIDGLADVETLLMFLLEQPVSVTGRWDDVGTATTIDVVVHHESGAVASAHEFPMSLADLARACVPALADANDDALVALLQRALAGVRVFNVVDEDDDLAPGSGVDD